MIINTEVHDSLYAMSTDGTGMDRMLQNIQARIIQRVLAHHQGNKTKAALTLGLKRTTLCARMQKLGLVNQQNLVDSTIKEMV